MIVGIDTGGTNVDGVLVDDGVVSATQVPGDRPNPIEEVLDELVDSAEDIERVVVVTTLVLNAAVQERLPHCTNVIVPGPGLMLLPRYGPPTPSTGISEATPHYASRFYRFAAYGRP